MKVQPSKKVCEQCLGGIIYTNTKLVCYEYKWCKNRSDADYIDFTREIDMPAWCPFVLEHIVSQKCC